MEPKQIPSDEIDLGQLFTLIKKGSHNLFKWFLRVFIYFKRNLIKLIILVTIGVGIGLLMNNLVPKRLKTEVLVKPNFESKDYLYAAIEEIGSNIRTKDTLFFKTMDIDVSELKNFTIDIESIEEEIDKDALDQKNNYLQILQNFQNNEYILSVIKSEILQNAVPIHRITFSFKNADNGEQLSKKILSYINANPYFKELQQISKKNAALRIENNEVLIKQIDGLVAGYSKNLSKSEGASSQGLVLLDTEKSLNIPSLLSLKNALIKDSEDKRIEILEQTNTINIQNFGKTQVVKKSLLGKNLVLFPFILVIGFILLSFILYLNKKAKELL